MPSRTQSICQLKLRERHETVSDNWWGAVDRCAVPAFADNPSGPYVGGSWGQFNLDIDNLNDVGQAVSSIAHSNADARKYFAGWRFDPYFAIEGAYVDLGNPGSNFTATGSNGNYHIHMDGFSPTAIGTLPLGPAEVFAEAGYLFYNVNLTANYTAPGTETVESSHSRSDFSTAVAWVSRSSITSTSAGSTRC